MSEEAITGIFVRDDDESVFSRDSEGNLLRQDDPSVEDYEKKITIQIDGRSVEVPVARPLTDASGNNVLDLEGRTTPRYTTIYDAAMKLYNEDLAKIPIPVLCHQPHMKPVAVCRLCVVQIYALKRGERSAERKLLPACQQHVNVGMEVFTMNSEGKDGDKVRRTVKVMTELLAADHLRPCSAIPDLDEYNELGIMAARTKADPARFQLEVFSDPPPPAAPLVGRRPQDDSSPVFSVDHSACILCERCIRACGDVKDNHVIGRTGKGATAGIGFDLNDAMAESDCVQCGECMVSCPTSAISFKPVAKVNIPAHSRSKEVLPIKELIADPDFQGISPKFLYWQQGLVVRRWLKAGDLLCRQGEPGNTAFIIKKGKLQVNVYPKTGETKEGLFGRLIPHNTSKPIIQVELTRENLIFGEMACLSGSPRSADVLVLEDGEAWELRRNVLDRLMRLPAQKKKIDSEYRKHSLDLVLRSTWLFKNLEPAEFKEILAYLREQISFARVPPGQNITRRGAPASDFFIVRIGHLKIDLRRSATEEGRFLSRGPGDIIGEISLLGLSSHHAYRSVDEVDQELQKAFERSGSNPENAVPPGLQTATCTALDFVDMARLNRHQFLEMVRRFPVIRRRLITESLRRLKSDDEPLALLNEFVGQGLYEARSVLLLDLDRCTRCDDCVRGCVQKHSDPKQQDRGGRPVSRMVRDGQRFANYLVATACRSCETAHCMTGCPVDAIHRGKHLQIVIEDHCIGCGLCAKNCPYGSIFMEPQRDLITDLVLQPKAFACDLCDSEGERDTPSPSCVSSCPHDAAIRLTGAQLLERVQKDA